MKEHFEDEALWFSEHQKTLVLFDFIFLYLSPPTTKCNLCTPVTLVGDILN